MLAIKKLIAWPAQLTIMFVLIYDTCVAITFDDIYHDVIVDHLGEVAVIS